MGESANEARRATSRRITRAAQQLTDEHGLDGFTMDDLAAAADVSRRTLFNYFPSKIDAVLGEWEGLHRTDVATFSQGGPTGNLVLDLRDLVVRLLDTHDIDRETLALNRRILLANPRLLSAVHQRHESISAEVVAHIVTREGKAFNRDRATVAIALLAAVFHSAIENYVEDPRNRSLPHHVDESLRTAQALLGA
ncbi:AcrR family transcriptional regulator [Marmoricola sp. OAE513]|uniref:TetR/AcrR family transcriptional regulator n=1 Tax=Marmoricola sp. OAE513 TaxID=2817894 RepID=UPI001AE18CC0